MSLVAAAPALAQDPTAPVTGPVPVPVAPTAPVLELGQRLPEAASVPGTTLSETRPVPTHVALLTEIAGDLGARAGDGASRGAGLGLVGGVAATYTSTTDGLPRARAWAAQVGAPGAAQAGVELTRWALRASGAQVRAAELPAPEGALLLTATRPNGGTTVTVAFGIEDWLYGVELGDPSGLPPDPALAVAAATQLAARIPRLATTASPRMLGVTPELRDELAAARRAARGPRRGGAIPVEGTVLAASDLSGDWALASFEGRWSELELFRRDPGGAWRATGDPGGPGCPRIPAPMRALWGLSAGCPPGASPVTRPDDPDASDPSLSPLRGPGIWVWEIGSSGGALAVARNARAAGFRTVFLKAGDGVNRWRQFERSVGTLKAAGLKVCAWQYVYGRAPEREARVLADAVPKGADCVVIDAEIEFERRGVYTGSNHRAVRRYLRALRARIGHRVPVAMSSFAYVDWHRGFPYSSFIEGADGVDALMPQVYWGDFRVSMAYALRRTMRWNAIYGVPVAPVAGTYRGETPGDLRGFRCLAAALGADGVSYWSLQHTRSSQVPALALPTRCASATAGEARYETLRPGAEGDAVAWLQTRLRAWGSPVPRTGFFRARTRAAVTAFQRTRGLPVTGAADPRTWDLLLSRPSPPPSVVTAPATTTVPSAARG